MYMAEGGSYTAYAQGPAVPWDEPYTFERGALPSVPLCKNVALN